jgi:alkanesulfonate monooxygenase SsuD/methylene tetrahydromethanopterin reductase-like flavin-dependent oxidoreductase (luciferase family)
LNFDVEFNSAGQVPSRGILEAAKLADKTNFGTIWKGESNSRDPTVLLSAIGSITKRIRVGTAVLHIFARTPVETGIMSATLDELTNGRFVLGLGVANKTLANWHGQTFNHPVKRAKEYISIIRQVFAAKKLQLKGDYYSSSGFKLEFLPHSPRIPIVLAALGPRMAELAGQVADGVLINMANPERTRFVANYASLGSKKTGRNFEHFEVITKVRCSINEDVEKAKAAIRKVVTFYTLADHYRDMLAEMGLAKEVDDVRRVYLQSGFRKASEHVTDKMLGLLPVVAATSVESLMKALKRFENCGATRIIIPYVPSTTQAAEETKEFVTSWAAAQ